MRLMRISFSWNNFPAQEDCVGMRLFMAPMLYSPPAISKMVRSFHCFSVHVYASSHRSVVLRAEQRNSHIPNQLVRRTFSTPMCFLPSWFIIYRNQPLAYSWHRGHIFTPSFVQPSPLPGRGRHVPRLLPGAFTKSIDLPERFRIHQHAGMSWEHSSFLGNRHPTVVI